VTQNHEVTDAIKRAKYQREKSQLHTNKNGTKLKNLRILQIGVNYIFETKSVGERRHESTVSHPYCWRKSVLTSGRLKCKGKMK